MRRSADATRIRARPSRGRPRRQRGGIAERHDAAALLGRPEGGGRGRAFKRLYAVSFQALVGNPVLPSGHRYTQFAYVSRTTAHARWCFIKGGSGP